MDCERAQKFLNPCVIRVQNLREKNLAYINTLKTFSMQQCLDAWASPIWSEGGTKPTLLEDQITTGGKL